MRTIPISITTNVAQIKAAHEEAADNAIDRSGQKITGAQDIGQGNA